MTPARRYEDAAALFRHCRRRGETVRKLIDCLIGAVAIGAHVPILHSDTDFDVLARHTELEVAEVNPRARSGMPRWGRHTRRALGIAIMGVCMKLARLLAMDIATRQ